MHIYKLWHIIKAYVDVLLGSIVNYDKPGQPYNNGL
jgi:hypothetical protein